MVVVVDDEAAFMISLDFLVEDAATDADDAVLELNWCCIEEVTPRFLKASDEVVVNAEGGILIREVFVGTAISEVVADDELMIQQQLIRLAKRKATDDRDEEK